MKKMLFLIILFMYSCSTIVTKNSLEWNLYYPQRNDSSLVKIKGLYNGYGKLFYNEKIRNDYTDSIKCVLMGPTCDEIKMAEKILLKEKSYYFNYNIEKTISYYRRYYRQYTKIITHNSDIVILINLVNYHQLDSESKKLFFKGIMQVIDSGDSSWNNSSGYKTSQTDLNFINLTKSKIKNGDEVRIILNSCGNVRNALNR